MGRQVDNYVKFEGKDFRVCAESLQAAESADAPYNKEPRFLLKDGGFKIKIANKDVKFTKFDSLYRGGQRSEPNKDVVATLEEMLIYSNSGEDFSENYIVFKVTQSTGNKLKEAYAQAQDNRVDITISTDALLNGQYNFETAKLEDKWGDILLFNTEVMLSSTAGMDVHFNGNHAVVVLRSLRGINNFDVTVIKSNETDSAKQPRTVFLNNNADAAG